MRLQGLYTVIRYIPDILREEFINVGVILLCPAAQYQGVRVTTLQEHRLGRCVDADGHFLKHALSQLAMLNTHEADALVGQAVAPDGRLDSAGLETLRGMYNNNIVLSPVRSVSVDEPEAVLERLFVRFVAPQAKPANKTIPTRTVIKTNVNKVFRQHNLFRMGVKSDVTLSTPTEPTVDFGYRNGHWHYYHAVPFVGHEASVKVAVNAYSKMALDTRQHHKAHFVALVSGQDSPLGQKLSAALNADDIDTIDYRDAPEVAEDITHDLTHISA